MGGGDHALAKPAGTPEASRDQNPLPKKTSGRLPGSGVTPAGAGKRPAAGPRFPSQAGERAGTPTLPDEASRDRRVATRDPPGQSRAGAGTGEGGEPAPSGRRQGAVAQPPPFCCFSRRVPGTGAILARTRDLDFPAPASPPRPPGCGPRLRRRHLARPAEKKKNPKTRVSS